MIVVAFNPKKNLTSDMSILLLMFKDQWHFTVTVSKEHEVRHDKTNKMTVRPAKTQVSLSAWRKLGPLATHWAHSEDWSDWVNAQADSSQKLLRIKVTPDLHLTYSKTGGNLGLVL